MATVILPAQMLGAGGGEVSLELEADSYRAALKQLQAKYPQIDDSVLARYAVAIDDTVINYPLLEPLEPDSELVFVPRIAGG